MLSYLYMEDVKVGIVGLGNVGSGTLAILADNADQIASKLGFRLKVVAVCSRSVHSKTIPEALGAGHQDHRLARSGDSPGSADRGGVGGGLRRSFGNH